MNRGFYLSACLALAVVSCKDRAAPKAEVVASSDGAARVRVAALGEGFKPADIHFKRGAQAELVFRRDTDETCATEVVFKALGLKKDLPLGQDVSVTIPTDKPAEYVFTCGMGMHKSRVVVE